MKKRANYMSDQINDISSDFFIGTYSLHKVEDTIQFAKKLAMYLLENDILALVGDLGAGKTTFTNYLFQALSKKKQPVTSPTFNLLLEYDITIQNKDTKLYHFDVYRMKEIDAFLDMGFDEYFYKSGITVIEWANYIKPILPKHTLWLSFLKEVDTDFSIANNGQIVLSEDEKSRSLYIYGNETWKKKLNHLCI